MFKLNELLLIIIPGLVIGGIVFFILGSLKKDLLKNKRTNTATGKKEGNLLGTMESTSAITERINELEKKLDNMYKEITGALTDLSFKISKIDISSAMEKLSDLTNNLKEVQTKLGEINGQLKETPKGTTFDTGKLEEKLSEILNILST